MAARALHRMQTATIVETLDAANAAIFRGGEVRWSGQRLRGNEQRHGEADAGERARGSQLAPRVFIRLGGPIQPHRQCAREYQTHRFADDETTHDGKRQGPMGTQHICAQPNARVR